MDISDLAGSAFQSFHSGQASEALEKALQLLIYPDHEAEMSHLAAACLHSLSRFDEALPYLKRAIITDTTSPTYHNTYGVVFRQAKKLDQSVRAYSVATDLDPFFADAFYNSGNVLSELKRKEEAKNQFLSCLKHKPNHNNAHHNLANIYRDQHDIDLALHHYQLSDESEHYNPDMHCNWGLAFQLKELWDKAIDCFEVAISQKSDHAPSYVNLGSALSVQEKFDEACAAFRRGVELDDSCSDAKFNLGLTLLTIGQLHEGWHFYETRLSLPDKVITPFPDIPIWDGNTNIDGPLMIWAEQGYGDNIQFVRYVSIVMELGIDVVLSTRKPLIKLFRECLQPLAPPIVEHCRSELQGFSYHIPLLSLPRVFDTSINTIPKMPGYLSVPKGTDFIPKVPRLPFAINIGLVWASGVDNKDMYADKSLPLDQLLPLFDKWRNERLLCIHSLQVGVDSSQLSPCLNDWGIYDWSSELHDFYDTANVISQLDLVVTVDTAVAHLAGALNKPVWVLLQHNADFRWLRGRSDSPWYNSMTLFRQTSLGDWSGAISKLSDRLKQLLG